MCGVGDVITSINDRKVTKAADLAIALDSFQVGETVTLKVRRGDEGSQVGCCANHCCFTGFTMLSAHAIDDAALFAGMSCKVDT